MRPRKSNRFPVIALCAIRQSGRTGVRTATLLASLPPKVGGEKVTEGRLRAVLHALHAQGYITCEGQSSTMRGMPMRVTAQRQRPTPSTTPVPGVNTEALDALERRLSRPQDRGTELRILAIVADRGTVTRSQIAEVLGCGTGGQLRATLSRMAGPWGLLTRATRHQRGGGFIYSLTTTGRAALSTYSELMAAR